MRKHQIKLMAALIVLTVAAALLTGCATSRQGDRPSIAGETPMGAYAVGKSPHYFRHKYVLYHHDGEKLWYLKSPYIPAGYYKGAPIGIAENWAVVGGSHVRKHQRAPLPFRNQTVKPTFSEY